MNEIKPNEKLKNLLDQFEKAGGVLDYVLVDLEGNDPTAHKTHRLAAIESMKAFSRHTDNWFEAVLKHLEYKNHSRDDFKRIQFDESQMSAEQITVTEFLGPLFDVKSRRLLIQGKQRNHLNNYFYAGDEEQYHTRIAVEVEIGEGYAYAFSEPPYGIQLEAAALNKLFLDLSDELFQGFSLPITIWQWSTDWSNYFDEGHEWWGSHLWTVYAQGNDFIVGIGASSTD